VGVGGVDGWVGVGGGGLQQSRYLSVDDEQLI